MLSDSEMVAKYGRQDVAQRKESRAKDRLPETHSSSGKQAEPESRKQQVLKQVRWGESPDLHLESTRKQGWVEGQAEHGYSFSRAPGSSALRRSSQRCQRCAGVVPPGLWA